MNTKAPLTLLAILIVVMLPLSQVFTNTTQPNAGRTGCSSPPTETNCGTSNCHNNTANTGSGILSFTYSDVNLKYIPGETYDMTVSTSETGKTKFGFEITSVDPNGDSVGTFIIPNGTTNLAMPTFGAVNHRRYLSHHSANSTNSWSFQWKAPAIDKGTLCFYIASNCANGNGQSSGDHIYTSSFCVNPDSANGIVSYQEPDTRFFIQSITNGLVKVQFEQPANERVLIQLYDLRGVIVQTLLDGSDVQGLQSRSFPLTSSLSSGLYLIRYNSGNADVTRKIFIQN